MLSEYDPSIVSEAFLKYKGELWSRLTHVLMRRFKHPTIEHTLSVLLEEVEELKKEIFKKDEERSRQRIYDECFDIAVVCIRLLIDHNLLGLNNIHQGKLSFPEDASECLTPEEYQRKLSEIPSNV